MKKRIFYVWDALFYFSNQMFRSSETQKICFSELQAICHLTLVMPQCPKRPFSKVNLRNDVELIWQPPPSQSAAKDPFD